APLGTAGRLIVLLVKKTSHSTVGLPRESRIARAGIARVSLIPLLVADDRIGSACSRPTLIRFPSVDSIVVTRFSAASFKTSRNEAFARKYRIIDAHQFALYC